MEVRATREEAIDPEERNHHQAHRPIVKESEGSGAPPTAVGTPLDPPGTTLPDVPPGEASGGATVLSSHHSHILKAV